MTACCRLSSQLQAMTGWIYSMTLASEYRNSPIHGFPCWPVYQSTHIPSFISALWKQLRGILKLASGLWIFGFLVIYLAFIYFYTYTIKMNWIYITTVIIIININLFLINLIYRQHYNKNNYSNNNNNYYYYAIICSKFIVVVVLVI